MCPIDVPMLQMERAGGSRSRGIGARDVVQPPAPAVGFFAFPTLQDERDTYDLWGWARTASDENFEGSWPDPPSGGFGNIHDDTEGDNLWTWILQDQRYGTVMTAAWRDYWRTQFVNNLVNALNANDSNASGVAGFGFDHMYGQGLAMMNHFYSDTGVVATMNTLMTMIQDTIDNFYGNDYAAWESRGPARHLIIACYIAEKTEAAAHIATRNTLIDGWVNSTDWEEAGVGGSNIIVGGNYFASRSQAGFVSGVGGAAAYDTGRRFNTPWQMGLHVEALWRAYLVTGRADVKDKLIKIARYIHYYAHRTSWLYPNIGGRFGHEGDGSYFHVGPNDGPDNNSITKPPIHELGVVNSQIVGWKLTGDPAFLTKARVFLNRGTKFPEGSGARIAADNEVAHFLDTQNNPDLSEFDYNKGELQYAYQIFENGGLPTLDNEPDTSALKTLANSLLEGEWGELTGVGNLSAVTDTIPGGVGHIMPYSQRCPWDPISRRAYILSSDDPGERRMVAYDEATNAFVNLSDIWGVGVNHTYCYVDIDIHRRRLWWFDIFTTGPYGYYDIPTDSYTTFPQGPYTGGDAAAGAYFPDRQSYVFWEPKVNPRLWERRDPDGTWVLLGSPNDPEFQGTYRYHTVCHYSRYHRCVFFGGGSSDQSPEPDEALYRLNLNGTIDVLSRSPVGAGLKSSECEIMEDPMRGVFHIFKHRDPGPQRWSFDPSGSGTWVNLGISGVPSDLFRETSGEDQKLATTISEYNVFFIVSGSNGAAANDIKVWLYKYAGA